MHVYMHLALHHYSSNMQLPRRMSARTLVQRSVKECLYSRYLHCTFVRKCIVLSSCLLQPEGFLHGTFDMTSLLLTAAAGPATLQLLIQEE